MEVGVQQSLRDDRMSDCRSLGSNFRASSQSRKISIGIMFDSLAKRKPGVTGDESKLPEVDGVNINAENLGEAEKKAVSNCEEKETGKCVQVSSPWITPRSFRENLPASETKNLPKQNSSCLGTSSPGKKVSGAKDTPAMHSVQFFSNQSYNLQTYKRKRGRDGDSERMEEFTFATTQEATDLDNVAADSKTGKPDNGKTETLKKKLWEILGTISSPKSQPSCPQACERNAINSKPEGASDRMRDEVTDPRQYSDTIETDSQSHDNRIKRTATRSITRKRAPRKVQTRKKREILSSKKHKQENVLSFKEGRGSELDGFKRGPVISNTKGIQKKSSRIEPRNICFPEKDKANDIQQTTNKSETACHKGEYFEKFQEKDTCQSPLISNSRGTVISNTRGIRTKSSRIEPRNIFFPEKDKANSQQTTNKSETARHKGEKVQGKDTCCQSPVTSKSQHVNIPDSPENVIRQDFAHPSLQNAVNPQDDFVSPTFEFRTPILIPSPGVPPDSGEIDHDARSPAASEGRFTMGNIRGFMTFLTPRPDCKESNEPSESPDSEKHMYSGIRLRSRTNVVKDVEEELHVSSSEERNSDSSGEDSAIIKGYYCHGEKFISPMVFEKSTFTLHSPERHVDHDCNGVTEFTLLPSPSPKVAGGSDWSQELAEQGEDNELMRAVALFALALENFKRKIDSATKKKSYEILVSHSDGIKLQLRNVESQIESDVGKLTTFSKSKRKHIEKRFQEQQEQLSIIHERFKDEIYSHLQDCKSTIEVLEAHQIDLHGTIKKQKVTHQKLLKELDETIEIQLNDAERRITAVHELARQKMFQLKCLVTACLKEG